jgi:hypothetical protein
MKKISILLVMLLFQCQSCTVLGNELVTNEITLDSITVYQPTSSTTWDASDTSAKTISWSLTTNGVDVYLYKGKDDSRLMQSFGYASKGSTAMNVILSTALPSGNDYYVKIEEWFGNYEIGFSDYFSITNSGSSDEDGENSGNPSSTDIAVSGNTIYVADQIDDLFIYNADDPAAPELVDNIEIEGMIEDTFVSGDHLYLGISQIAGSTDSFYGLAMLNISDPLDPSTPTYVNTKGKVYGIYISGGYAYLTVPWGYDESGVSHTYNSLALIDVEDPTNPGEPIYKELDEHLAKVWVKGKYAFTIVTEQRIAVLDVSDPENLGTPSYITVDGMGEDLFIDDENRLFLTSDDGIKVIDVTDPLNPGDAVNTGIKNGLPKAYGDLLFTKYGQFVHLYDISDLTNPEVLFSKSVAGLVFDFEVVGDYLFVADYGGGLKCFYFGDALITDTAPEESQSDETSDSQLEDTEGTNETDNSPINFGNLSIEFIALLILSICLHNRHKRRMK